MEPKIYFADVQWFSIRSHIAPMDIQQAIKNGLVESRQQGDITEVEIVETTISTGGKGRQKFHLNYKPRFPS